MPAFVLPDILAPGLRILFCGSAASRISAARGYNYANPGNQFWPVLKRVGLVPPDFNPAEFRTLPCFGLGLTDLCKSAIGNDDELSAEHFDTAALTRKIRKYQPQVLAFTSKFSAANYLGRKVNYGEQDERIGLTRIFVLPSTSGQARRFFDESFWRSLANTRYPSNAASIPA